MITKNKLKRVQLLIPKDQKEFLDSVAQKKGLNFSALVRSIFAQYQQNVLEQDLAKAAHSLYGEYESNQELVAFTAIDGDDFA
ncbi:MAG: hypothetical protein MAG431_01817 [Chloroflexi bacterium]|nr:hypothetical protein [Chloroflexota bacterium]